tara:strand:- start:314 stop:1387 length:1074 start_codon:yes stop_codon:yes gene_type:complete
MKPLKINDWTHKKEKLLRFWQEECRLYNWLYIQNTQHYEFMNKSLSITSIFLSAVTGTTLINNSDCGECEDSTNYIILVFGIITVINTFIQGAKEFLNLPEKININTNAARQNNAIIMDIDEQINIHPSDRINGKDFLKSIKLRKNELIQNGPVIPRKCWNKLRSKIAKGENINFFNNHIFQEYLDQTININKLDFHEEDNNINSDSSSNKSNSSSDKSDSIYQNKEFSIYNMNSLNHNVSDINNLEEDKNLKQNNTVNLDNNISDINYNNNNIKTSLSYTSGSEDEFLDDIKNNNMCKQQLEFNLKNTETTDNNKNNNKNDNKNHTKNDKNNINKNKSNIIIGKFDTQLQYQMSRI